MFGALRLWTWTSNDEAPVDRDEPIYGEYRFRYTFRF